MTNQLPAVQATDLLPMITAITPERAKSWLQLGAAKQTVLQTLQAKNLEAQGKLLAWETMTALELQTALAEHTRLIKDMPEFRKGFTKYLDKIVEEMMAPEKDAAKWEVIEKAKARLVQLKLDSEKAANEAAAKTAELANFKAHVTNEYHRLIGDYRVTLNKTINDAYLLALAGDLTDDGVVQHVELARKCLNEVKPGTMTQFMGGAYKYHTRDELAPVFTAIPKPDYATALAAAHTNLNEKFSLYWSDKANTEAAATHIKQTAAIEEATIVEEVTSNSAMTTLLAKAEAVVVPVDTGVKQLTRKKVLTIVSSPEWTLKVITAFVANWSKCQPEVRVKLWENLSVKQMSAALDAAEVEVAGLQYTEVVK